MKKAADIKELNRLKETQLRIIGINGKYIIEQSYDGCDWEPVPDKNGSFYFKSVYRNTAYNKADAEDIFNYRISEIKKRIYTIESQLSNGYYDDQVINTWSYCK